jgi:lipopolysaccharide assembly outer membrane protein LptD (OstA)
MNFTLMRRLHLSFLLPAVLVHMILLATIANSVYAQMSENQEPILPATQAIPKKTSDVITWQGNVEFKYEPQKITATSDKAEYFQSERKVVLSGNVKISQSGKMQSAETATFFVTDEIKVTADAVNMPTYK